MRIFDMDGPVYTAGTELADAMILTILWFIGCLPIVTIGTSTSALFYIYGKKARGEDAYVWRDFWKSYRQNFAQSIPVTLILGLMWLSVYAYIFIMEGYQGGAPTLLAGLSLFFTLEVTLMTIYVLAVLSRFHMKVFNMFLTAFVLAHKHILTTVMIVVGVILLQYVSMVIPFVIIIMPILIAAVASIPIQKIFTQHIKASEEIKEAEAKAQEMIELDEDDTYEDEDDAYDDEEADEDKDNENFLKYI